MNTYASLDELTARNILIANCDMPSKSSSAPTATTTTSNGRQISKDNCLLLNTCPGLLLPFRLSSSSGNLLGLSASTPATRRSVKAIKSMEGRILQPANMNASSSQCKAASIPVNIPKSPAIATSATAATNTASSGRKRRCSSSLTAQNVRAVKQSSPLTLAATKRPATTGAKKDTIDTASRNQQAVTKQQKHCKQNKNTVDDAPPAIVRENAHHQARSKSNAVTATATSLRNKAADKSKSVNTVSAVAADSSTTLSKRSPRPASTAETTTNVPNIIPAQTKTDSAIQVASKSSTCTPATCRDTTQPTSKPTSSTVVSTDVLSCDQSIIAIVESNSSDVEVISHPVTPQVTKDNQDTAQQLSSSLELQASTVQASNRSQDNIDVSISPVQSTSSTVASTPAAISDKAKSKPQTPDTPPATLAPAVLQLKQPVDQVTSTPNAKEPPPISFAISLILSNPNADESLRGELFNSMKKEADRLYTFERFNWPNKCVQPSDLAKAGLFYMLKSDRVMCAFCKLVFYDWKPNTIPIKEHYEHNPRCRFLRGHSDNVPIDKNAPTPEVMIDDIFGPQNVCGIDNTPLPLRGSIAAKQQMQLMSQSNAIEDETGNNLIPRLSISFDDDEEIYSKMKISDDYEFEVHEPDDFQVDPSRQIIVTERETVPSSIELTNDEGQSDDVRNQTSLLSERMKCEQARLETFQRWPCQFIKPKDLALVGFFYTLDRDRVQCAFCEMQLHAWEPGDRPIMEHLRTSPNCPFLSKEQVGNRPIDETRIESMFEELAQVSGVDIAPTTSNADNFDDNIFSSPERPSSSLFSSSDYDESVSTDRQQQERLAMLTLEARLNSFANWPANAKVDAKSLAAAGLYYKNAGEYVQCFSCGGCFSRWESGDDPWIEHAKFYPNCEFVRYSRGKDFIERFRLPANKLNCNADKRPPSQQEIDVLVENELTSKLIKEFLEIHPTSEDVLRNVLAERFRSTRRPFDNLAELWCACDKSQASSNEKHFVVGREPECKNTLCSGSTASSGSPPNSGNEQDSQANMDTLITMCKICMCNEVGVTLQPCAHLCLCISCATVKGDTEENAVTHCPICRVHIEGKIRSILV